MLHQFLHRHAAVGGIVPLYLFQVDQVILVPIVGVDFIVGDAGAVHIDERKSLVLNPLFDQTRQLLQVAGKPLGDKARPGRQSHFHRREGRLDGTPGRTVGFEAHGTAGRGLPLGQTVNLVIHHNVRDVHVAPNRMDGMPHSDGKAVSVTPRSHHRQVPVGQFQPLGDGKGTAVDPVKAVSIQIPGDTAGATDPRNERHIFRFQTEIGKGALHGGQYGKVSAPRAPVGFYLIPKLFKRGHGPSAPCTGCKPPKAGRACRRIFRHGQFFLPCPRGASAEKPAARSHCFPRQGPVSPFSSAQAPVRSGRGEPDGCECD